MKSSNAFIASAAAAIILTVSLSFAQDGVASRAAAPSLEPEAATNAATFAEEAAAYNGASVSGSQSIDEPGLSGWESFCQYIRQGGKTMIFIGILSILGLGCALERFCRMYFCPSRVVPEHFSAEIVKKWNDKDFDGIDAACRDSKSILARVVETIMEHRSSTDYQEVKMFAEDKAGRELRLENRKAGMLGTVATIAPLLGLFGTVVGLLGAFQTVAKVGEMGDPAILADDIGKALVTTVAGLAVAMPALFAHQLLKAKLGLYSIILEEEVSDLVNKLFIQSKNGN